MIHYVLQGRHDMRIMVVKHHFCTEAADICEVVLGCRGYYGEARCGSQLHGSGSATGRATPDQDHLLRGGTS